MAEHSNNLPNLSIKQESSFKKAEADVVGKIIKAYNQEQLDEARHNHYILEKEIADAARVEAAERFVDKWDDDMQDSSSEQKKELVQEQKIAEDGA